MIRKLKDFLHRPNSLKGATGILAITLFLSNVLGLLRNVVLAGKFQPEEKCLCLRRICAPDHRQE